MSAFKDLEHFEDWGVRRADDDPFRFEAVFGPGFGEHMFRPLPATSGTADEFARSLITQAAMSLASMLDDRDEARFRALAPPNATLQEIEDIILKSCRGRVLKQLEDIAHYGDTEEGGQHVAPFDALLRLAESRHLGRGGEHHSEAANEPKRSSPSPHGLTWRSRKGLKLIKRTPTAGDLKRALKYAFSSSMGARVRVATAYPLQFTFAPEPGFEARFDLVLQGREANDSQRAARTLVLRALVDIAERLEAQRAREWLPAVAWDRVNDSEVGQASEELLTAEVRRRMSALIDAHGVTAFARYFEPTP